MYRDNAGKFQQTIAKTNGLSRAASLLSAGDITALATACSIARTTHHAQFAPPTRVAAKFLTAQSADGQRFGAWGCKRC
jgi:hypothetical protein